MIFAIIGAILFAIFIMFLVELFSYGYFPDDYQRKWWK